MVLPGTAWFIKKNRIYSCRVTVQKVCAHTALTVRKHRFISKQSVYRHTKTRPGEIKKMKIIEYFTSEKKEHWLDETKNVIGKQGSIYISFSVKTV